MRDRLFYPLAFLAAIAMTALALNWPEGDALPPGSPPAQPTPAQPTPALATPTQATPAEPTPETPAS
jgi:hypothetical protein